MGLTKDEPNFIKIFQGFCILFNFFTLAYNYLHFILKE